MPQFIDSLIAADIPAKSLDMIPRPPEWRAFMAESAPITVRRVFEAINSALTPDMVVVSDVGDALFGAMDLVIRSNTEFLSPAYYAPQFALDQG